MAITYDCRCPPPAPTCDLDCDDLTCNFAAIDQNIENLFDRTDDLNEVIGSVTEHGRVVTTETELLAAIAIGMPSYVQGSIELTGEMIGGRNVGLNPQVEDTQIYGLSNGVTTGRLVLPHVSGMGQTVIRPGAKNLKLWNLGITTEHPLTSDTGDADYAIDLPYDTTTDVSGMSVKGCEIYQIHTAVYRPNVLDAKIVDGLVFSERNNIHSFCYGGIYLASNCRRTLIEDNRIFGRNTPSATHLVPFNGIWLGNNADYAQIHKNDIAYIGRHGIEYWNSQTDPETTTGNKSGKISFNNIHDHVPTAGVPRFGITAFGHDSLHVIGNTVSESNIGIEVYNDPVNNAENIIVGNTINNIDSGATATMMGINYATNAYIAHNTFGSVVSAVGNNRIGMQFYGGVQNVTVKNNKFIDSGNLPILVIGNNTDNRITISDNEFIIPTFYTGLINRAIWLTGIASACVKNNTSWCSSGLALLDAGRFTITGAAGTVYVGHSTEAPVVCVGPDVDLFGSNLKIQL